MEVKSWVRSHPVILSGALLGSACAGALIYNRKAISKSVQSWRMLRSVLNVKRRIHIITTGEAWTQIEPLLLSEAKRVGVLGFDCEWVHVRGSRRPVALLQLASCSGLCVLVRLSHMKSNIPDSLKALLANTAILKVGVGPVEDSNYLSCDYDLTVRGCVDLRHLVLQTQHLNKRVAGSTEDCKSAGGMGLSALAYKYLGRTLDKDWRVRASDWEADTLTQRQESYAADDALVGILILMMIVEKLWIPTSPAVPFQPSSVWNHHLCRAILHICSRFIDVKFSSKKDPESGVVGKCKQNQNLKPMISVRAYSIRKEPLYHHCQLWAPDDMPLCRIDPKKARWYVEKGLGHLVRDDPIIVRLNFEPAGRPLMETKEGKFRLQERENICVVCGKDESYIRKNIVPHEYRKYFPEILKSHENHDIVLLCIECHMQSNVFDNTLRNELASEFNAPLSTDIGAKVTVDKSLKAVKHAANALMKNRHKMPEKRIAELENILKEYYTTGVLDEKQLQKACEVEVKVINNDYQAHSYRVYEAYKKIGVVKLEQRWRQHFLCSMKPKYMPDCWSVTHNAVKVQHKMSTLPIDHPDQEIYKMVLIGTDGSPEVPYIPSTTKETTPIQ